MKRIFESALQLIDEADEKKFKTENEKNSTITLQLLHVLGIGKTNIYSRHFLGIKLSIVNNRL